MLFNNFSEAFLFIQGQGYLIFFIVMVLEGPIVNTAAAFAASFGHFNVFIIFFLAVLGDLTGDIIYFYIGRVSKIAIVERYEKKMGFAKDKIDFVEKNIKKHFFKTMLIIKLMPGFATVGLMLMGATKSGAMKFIGSSLLITIPTCIFFTAFGYYGGKSFDIFFNYLKLGQFVLLGLVIIILVSIVLYKKIGSKIYNGVYKK